MFLLRRALIAAVLIAAAVPVGAVASARDGGATARASSSRLTISVRSTRYGKVLTDGSGRVFYLFTHDKGKTSRCYGACASAWPVAFTGGTPRAGSGARASLLGTTKRRGGGLQATYAGHPLYYYVGDRAAAQVTCQNVNEFGGLWLVVRASGRAVHGG